LVINVTGQGGTGLPNVMTLESSTGIKLVMDSSKTSYPLTHSGFAVGTFNSSNSLLTYSDNTYEQF
jgi:hypothetical protein